MSVLMEVSILVGEDRGWEFRRIGAGVAQERKQQEVGVVTWWEAGKIEGNYATMLHILQSKKGVRGGKVQGMQSCCCQFHCLPKYNFFYHNFSVKARCNHFPFF